MLRSCAVLVALLCAAPAAALTEWSTDVTTPTVWCDATNTGPIILSRPIFVSSKLTILPGCVVRGQPRTAGFNAATPTVGAPGVLVISRDGFLDAQGTSTNPIIFTTAAPDANANGVADDTDTDPTNGRTAWTSGDPFLDHDPAGNPLAPLALDGTGNGGLWGGLVILGRAPTNLGKDSLYGYGNGAIEGLTVPGFPFAGAYYGGTRPHDASAILRFVSVRHAGADVGSGNDLPGILLGGVGDGTVLENIEVYAVASDCINVAGGIFTARNLALSFCGDDSMDLDRGYAGSIQHVVTLSPFFNEDSGVDYGVGGSGDAAGEWDGHDPNVNLGRSVFGGAEDIDRPYPLGAAAVYNMTLLGNQPGGSNPAASAAAANRGIRMRNDFEGMIANALIVNTGTRPCWEVASANLAGVPDQVRVFATTCSDGAVPDAEGLAAAARGEAEITAGSRLGGATPSNYGPSLAGGAAASPLLANEDTFFEPKCAAAPVPGHLAGCKAAAIDPRPAIGTPTAQVSGGIVPTGPGLDASATYRGAFPAGQPLFTDGWTALDAGGLF